VSLFQFGRGIRCDCGAWVDLQRGHLQPLEAGQTAPACKGGWTVSISITSTAFREGGVIPKLHTGDGGDLSPPLRWESLPEGTKELALICDDPDAPTAEPWVHWVIYKIPADVKELPQGLPSGTRVERPLKVLQGRNSWSSGRTIGYRGPAPPPGHGVHHYHFRLYALDCELAVNPGIDKASLLKAMDGHILAQGELVGTYQR
jgi:Raf kinase inhibitor-like YbhB/YbcL family protein